MQKDWFINAIVDVLTGSRKTLHAPEEDVEPGEELLGVLENPIARAMYSLLVDLQKSRDALCEKLNSIVQVEGDISRETMTEIEPEIHQAWNQSSVVENLFWELVHQEFPKSRINTVSAEIKKGWKIVVFENNKPSFFDHLQMQTNLIYYGRLFAQDE